MPREKPALPTAPRLLVAARPSHASPTRQPSVFPAKEGVSQPNSASGEHRKVPSRGRFARSPGRDGMPGKGGVSIISGSISPGMFFSCPHLWVSVCMDGFFFRGWNIFIPIPLVLFFAPSFFFLLRGKALDSAHPSHLFEPHVWSFFLLILFVWISV